MMNTNVLRTLTQKEIKKELSLQKEADKDLSIDGLSENQLAPTLSKILSTKGKEPITDVVKDVVDGIPPVYAILSKIRLTSSILALLTTKQLRDELKNQGVKISLTKGFSEEDVPRTEIIKRLLDEFAREDKAPILPYTEPLQAVLRNLTCPSLTGVDVTFSSGDETAVLTLSRGDLLQMSVLAIRKELSNQGLGYEDKESKLDIADRLLNHLRRNPTNSNREFSREFKAYLEARKAIIQEDSTQQYLQAVQNNPQILVPKVTINLDDRDGIFPPGAETSVLQTNQAPIPKPSSQGLIQGTQKMKSKNKLDRIVKTAMM